MRIGDIYQNLYAGVDTYLIYTGERATSHDTKMWIITKDVHGWLLKRGVFSIESLFNDDRFPIVGHIDLDKAKDRFVNDVLERVRVG